MKKLTATLLTVIGLAGYANAQGTFIVDSTANSGATATSTSGGLVFINGVLDTATDINLNILWGTSAASVTTQLNLDPGGANTGAYTGIGSWFASQATGGGDIGNPQTGAISDPNGYTYAVPNEAAGTLIYLQLQAWTGASTTFAGVTANGANAGYAGASSIFAITLASNSNPTQPDIHNVSSINLLAPVGVPEPGTMALAAIGGASLLLFRRRK